MLYWLGFFAFGASALAGLYIIRAVVDFIRYRHLLDASPGGYILPYDIGKLTGFVVSTIFPMTGKPGDCYAGFAPYRKHRSSIISTIPFLTPWHPTYFSADAEVCEIILGDKRRFVKDVKEYILVSFYGPNVIGTEGEDWRRHRGVTKSAFGEANNAYVFTETSRIVRDWFSNLEEQEDATTKEVVVDVKGDMTRITLMVISSTGFGRRISWSDDAAQTPPPPHTLTFRAALGDAVHLTFVKVFAWISPISLSFIPIVHKVETAYTELKDYMMDMILEEKLKGVDEKIDGASKEADLFRRLMGANEGAESGTGKLSDDELLSNVYTFLLAGHETSTNALSFTLGLLAIYSDEQAKVYDEAMSVWPEGEEWPEDDLQSFKHDLPKLEYTLAAFRESLRLYPLVVRNGRHVTEDTTVTATTWDKDGKEERITVPLAKGSLIMADIRALHLSERYWGDDVDDFKPERFIDTPTYKWPRGAFIPFLTGPRACLGQRFATVEICCILAHIVRRYEILPPKSLEGMSPKEMEKKLMRWNVGITAYPVDLKLRFRRRGGK